MNLRNLPTHDQPVYDPGIGAPSKGKDGPHVARVETPFESRNIYLCNPKLRGNKKKSHVTDINQPIPAGGIGMERFGTGGILHTKELIRSF